MLTTTDGMDPPRSMYQEYAVTLVEVTRLDAPAYRVTSFRRGSHAYLIVYGAATPVSWLGTRLPCRTRSCVVHGVTGVPHPVGAGARARATSSAAENWKLRT